jgi:hypothetical protein
VISGLRIRKIGVFLFSGTHALDFPSAQGTGGKAIIVRNLFAMNNRKIFTHFTP